MTKLASRIPLRIAHQLRMAALARILCLLFGIAVIAAHNAAHAQNCPANIPHVTGTWTVLPYQMPISPISTTLLLHHNRMPSAYVVDRITHSSPDGP